MRQTTIRMVCLTVLTRVVLDTQIAKTSLLLLPKMLATFLACQIVQMANVILTTAVVELASVMRAKPATIKTNVCRKKLVPTLVRPLEPFVARCVVKIAGPVAKARCVKKVLV